MRIATLLDLDNIKPRLPKIEEVCQTYGTIVYRHAFSNTPAVLTAYGGAFREFGYRFELAPGLDPQPQEVDTLIKRTARELAENRQFNIEAIAVVSNDNGYAVLFDELRRYDIKTLAIGGRQIGLVLRGRADYVCELDEVLRPVYIGIDLGTTNTVMASASIGLRDQQWKANEIQVSVTDEKGSLVMSPLVPSSVRMHAAQNEVGGHIRAHAYAFRDSTILAWKHDMGRSERGRPCGYNLSVGRIAPEQAASAILAFCRKELVNRFPSLQGAVITHPASYESDAIEATRKAAVLAGWREDEVVLLPEPHAALYDFLHRMERGEFEPPLDIYQPTNLLVYDLGGGTLDVSLHQVHWDLQLKRFVIRDLAVGSRTRIGGDTVDDLIAEYVLDNYPDCWSLTPREREKLLYELRIYAEKFKRLWGAQYSQAADQESFALPFQGNFLEGQLSIRLAVNAALMRQMLEKLMCDDLGLRSLQEMEAPQAFDGPPFTDRFDSLVVPVLELLLKARQSTGATPRIDAVLLNGGMTYFPLVQERLQSLFSATVLLNQGHPDMAVARGAALFAAGVQGRAARRVNPTNIYLEVNDAEQHSLRLLVAQGQTYPYHTRLPGFKLPSVNEGRLGFKVWVGMGSRPNNNTTLQRTRYVSLAQVYAAHLQPGTALDLEVEYTFDERLKLMLVAVDGSAASFALEIAGDDAADNGAHEIADLIPAIPRERKGRAPTPGIVVSFQEWDKAVKALALNWNDGALWEAFKELEGRMALADNRLDHLRRLVQWLPPNPRVAPVPVQNQTVLAVRVICALLQSCAETDSVVIPLEATFQRWVLEQYQRGFVHLPGLLQELGETPGKLLWPRVDDGLVQAFTAYQSHAQAQVFLNSLGKCARPTAANLRLLYRVMSQGQHLAQREKAAWALARLLSPGQPAGWQASFAQVEEATKLVLNRLITAETEAQVVLSLVGCLYQCIAWQFLHRRFPTPIIERVRHLSITSLAAAQSLVRYPDIQRAVLQKFNMLPYMLDIDQASAEDKSRIREYLLEVTRH